MSTLADRSSKQGHVRSVSGSVMIVVVGDSRNGMGIITAKSRHGMGSRREMGSSSRSRELKYLENEQRHLPKEGRFSLKSSVLDWKDMKNYIVVSEQLNIVVNYTVEHEYWRGDGRDLTFIRLTASMIGQRRSSPGLVAGGGCFECQSQM
jgi:hypothetical protein